MARMVASTYVTVMLGMAASAVNGFTLPDISTLSSNSVYFRKVPGEKCGEGADMYYGIVTPKTIISPKKFWVESAGGAICFSNSSCLDAEYGVWLDLYKMVVRYVRTPPFGMATLQDTFNYLTSGNALPLDLLRSLKVGYLPNFDGGPLDGQVGFYWPGCTGDAGLGNYVVNYTKSMTIHHSGAVGFMMLLQAIKNSYSAIEHLTLIGASGSGVSRLAWAPVVADMFPTTSVSVVADSAMHVLPATEVFTYFWDEVQWSPNPNGKHNLAKLYMPQMTSLPKFDWRHASAISTMLQQYGGRVKVLYIACNKDEIVYKDRTALCHFAQLTATDQASVEKEMWDFLKRLVRESPVGSVFTYISDGKCHHQTRGGFENPINAAGTADVGPEKFTKAFLNEKLPTPAHMWCCGQVPPTPQEISSADSPMPPLVAMALLSVWAVIHE